MHAHSVALQFLHYNFAKIHQSLPTTPAIATGVTNRLWEIEDLVCQDRYAGRYAKVIRLKSLCSFP